MNNRQTLRATVTTSVRRLHKTRSTFEADASRAQSSQSATRRDIHQQEPTLETTTKSGKLSNLGAIISAATRRVSRLRDTGTRDCRARVINAPSPGQTPSGPGTSSGPARNECGSLQARHQRDAVLEMVIRQGQSQRGTVTRAAITQGNRQRNAIPRAAIKYASGAPELETVARLRRRKQNTATRAATGGAGARGRRHWRRPLGGTGSSRTAFPGRPPGVAGTSGAPATDRHQAGGAAACVVTRGGRQEGQAQAASWHRGQPPGRRGR